MDKEIGAEEGLRRGRVGEAATHEDLGERLADAELVGEPVSRGELDRRDAPGAVVDQGASRGRVYPRAGDGCRPGRSGERQDADVLDGAPVGVRVVVRDRRVIGASVTAVASSAGAGATTVRLRRRRRPTVTASGGAGATTVVRIGRPRCDASASRRPRAPPAGDSRLALAQAAVRPFELALELGRACPRRRGHRPAGEPGEQHGRPRRRARPRRRHGGRRTRRRSRANLGAWFSAPPSRITSWRSRRV